MAEDNMEPVLLPHHEQQTLCSTRLPYRQGRKLTAVKAYTVNNESRHLLVFGVPSLNLRQETKALFSRFGKLQFNITKYPSEQFTETYHAIFDDIQAARLAKKMLDTKNYYGGNLHVCYAPELETVDDARQKLLLRQKSVVARLKNLQKQPVTESCANKPNNTEITVNQKDIVSTKKLYMGDENSIAFSKRKSDFKSVSHCKLKKSRNVDRKMCVTVTKNDFDVSDNVAGNFDSKTSVAVPKNDCILSEKESDSAKVTDIVPNTACEIVDFTSVETEILTNINDSLNYNNFGKEVVRQVPYKPVNKIKFYMNKNP